MRFLSLFSGIEAASVAWKPLGWKAAAVAEIEPFPCAVLAHHYPDVPNLGDVTKYKEWPDLGTVDVVCGGSPCQSFSVAGLRQGLADPRGNLSLTFLAVVDKYRPRYVVWENVPGVLSSNGGRDFASFLGGLGQLGYGWSYRVLDAQYARVDGFPYAVPQRRRRVVVVGYLGDWRRAAAVLSEPESVLGDTPPSRKAGQAVAAAAMQGADGGGWPAEVAPTLGTAWADRHPGSSMQDWVSQKGGLFVPAHVDPVASCVTRGFAQRIDAETENFVAHQNPIAFEANMSLQDPDDSGAHPTLTRRTHAAVCVGNDLGAIAFAQNTRDEVRLFGGDGQTVGALAAEPGMKQKSYVAHAIQAGATRENPASGPDGVGVQEGVAYTLEARPEVQAVQSAWAVRRLTPVECARLQGFPDDYLTQVEWRGKTPPADGPMYKALGNSWAVNVFRWVGYRIEMVEEIAKEIAA